MNEPTSPTDSAPGSEPSEPSAPSASPGKLGSKEVARLAREIGRRRTFAIISHPDAGKTTLTEKLLLFGGAIDLAGSVKARRADRHATSDWMDMEKERGISITASVMTFDYQGFRINLLDTPGHQDFSEDTYRALTAADSAVMLLDNRKGVEEQTRKLFSVCRKRRLPIVTLVNKCDRVGEDPFGLLDDVQTHLGITCFPLTWPVRREERLIGVCDRQSRGIFLYDQTRDHGQTLPPATVIPLDDPALDEALEPAVLDPLREELELLDAAGEEMDHEAVSRGEATPAFFGSALTNFGLDVFFRRFLEMAPPPGPVESTLGPVLPEKDPFSGFIFKVQANMNLRHRDRVAFLKVCSGRFEAGAEANVFRTERVFRLSQPQELLAQERSHAEEVVAGDVVGLHDRGNLRVGDTVSMKPGLEYAGVPRFSPEHFAQVRLEDHLRRKHLDRGLRHLAKEGTILLLFSDSISGPVPIVGAVGRLQFEVLVARLKAEYGVTVRRTMTLGAVTPVQMVALNADVVGYSQLLSDDFESTMASMEEVRCIVSERVAGGGGTLADFVGDNFMAIFGDPRDAVGTAIAIATEIEARNADVPKPSQLRFRMGLDQGEVIRAPSIHSPAPPLGPP